jgi:hypothetical protein
VGACLHNSKYSTSRTNGEFLFHVLAEELLGFLKDSAQWTVLDVIVSQ